MQIVVSAGCFALASTLMLAPLDAITGSDDPVADARALGQSLAAAVVSDVLDDPVPAGADTSHGLAGALHQLETRLVDLFVREAAQEVAFGASLTGTRCDAVFTETMRAQAPSPGDRAVLDAVGACDDGAAGYASTPSLWQPFSVFVTSSGSLALLGLVAALAAGLLGAVASTVIASIRAMFWVHIAILPGVGRRRFLRAMADALGALVTIVVLIVGVSGAAALIVMIADRVAEAGTPLTVQMACVAGVTAASAIGFATIGRRLRDRGRSAAEAVRSFVVGGVEHQPAREPVSLGGPRPRGALSR